MVKPPLSISDPNVISSYHMALHGVMVSFYEVVLELKKKKNLLKSSSSYK